MIRILLVAVFLFMPSLALGAGHGAHSEKPEEHDWYPSKWGADDTLGSVNEITPEIILNAAKLIKVGKRYALGEVTSRTTPAAGTRDHLLFVFSDGADGLAAPLGTNNFKYFDDYMFTHMGVGSQIDGLGHAAIGDYFYNGLTPKAFYHCTGLTKFGIEEIPPMVTRGVVLDMVGYLKNKGVGSVMNRGGVDMIKGGTTFTKADIQGALKRQGISLQTGDVVITHSGYMKMQELDPAMAISTWPGIGVEAAEYIASFNPVAVGGDTTGTEAHPPLTEGEFVPVHQELITKRGIYLLENLVTDELVRDEAWEFMFVLGQARFKGAVQMVINPVAIR